MPLYTLAEAKLELNRQECKTRGHNYRIMEMTTGPVKVICDRCGKAWNVTAEEQAAE